MKKALMIMAFMAGFISVSEAQEEKHVVDSTIIKQDSSVYNAIDEVTKSIQDSSRYRKIESLSRKSKVTRTLHRILFHPVIKEKALPSTAAEKIRSAEFRNAEGKRIRKITIVTLDPFGYSLTDTSVHSHLLLVKAANWVHAKTNIATIKNLLLFRENERYDSLRIKESERLVRSQKFIREVFFTILAAPDDSVDIFIRVQDVWSLIPSLSRTGAHFFAGATDLNFAGTGNSLAVNTWWMRPGHENVTHVRYQIPNFRNSYINLNFQYLLSLNNRLEKVNEFPRYFYSPVSYNPQYLFSDNKNILRSFEASRTFYSPYTKWAGGIFLGQMMATQSYIRSDTLRYLSSRINVTDLWIGRSWLLDIDPSVLGVTNIVLTSRVVNVKSPDRSLEALNADIFNSHRYYFGSISLSSRKYILDRYVFNYGINEDVPVGRILGLTIGLESQVKNRFYLGIDAGWGGYNAYGYLSTHLSYGTFKGSNGFQEGTFIGRMNYYTKLMSFGGWKLRQFVRTSFMFGINRHPADNLPLRIGIKGFESIESRALNVTVVSLQTQTYAPWNLGGFHFGPYLFAHLGFLKGEPLQVRNNRFYSLLGFGVLIKNDYLMFSTFQLSLAFYPFIPEKGYNLFRMNAYKTTDYGFQNFESTKPGIAD